jgi:hypothetical protein
MPVASIVISALAAVRSFGVGDAALFGGLLGLDIGPAACAARHGDARPRDAARGEAISGLHFLCDMSRRGLWCASPCRRTGLSQAMWNKLRGDSFKDRISLSLLPHGAWRLGHCH